jgi:hypothetical protein
MECAVRDFIRALPDHYNSIDAIFLFGSFIKSTKYRDVDVILVFNDVYMTNAARDIERAFRNSFSLELHTQLFLSSEINKLNGFLYRAGSWECIYGQGLTPEYPFFLRRAHA